MRLSFIPILLALTALSPTPFAWGQKRIRSDAKLTEESLALWGDLKTALQAKDGDAFFESHLKNSLFPGGTNGVHVFSGTIVGTRPAEHPSELVLAITDNVHAEATVRLVDKEGNLGHFDGPITRGSKVAFIGTVTGFQKDPFMLTFDVQGEDGSGPTYALVLVAMAFTKDIPVSMPAVQVNYRSRSNTGFIKMDMDDSAMYPFTVVDHGVSTEMNGVRLERYLVTAGWYPQPSNGVPHYAVEIDGTQPAVTLDLVGLGSFDKQAWVVPTARADSTPEAALVVVRADGTLIQRVEGIRRIQVSEKQ
jgi:hypothetical protein